MAAGRLLKWLLVFWLLWTISDNNRPNKDAYLKQNSLKRPTAPQRRRFFATAIKYTVNGISTFNLQAEASLLIAGDINPNPGPEVNTHEQIDLPKQGLRICQWNIYRLSDTKFEQIKLLLTSSTQQIDVLFLLETFLKPKTLDCIYEIPGYTLFRKDRPGTKQGGGIIAFVSQKVKVKRNEELGEDNIEIMWLNINPFNSKRSILCGALYRPPSSNADIDLQLEKNIESAYLKNTEIHIMGDFNIDYLKTTTYNKHSLSKALKCMHLEQLVKTVTRPASGTCLDHVYTSHTDFISHISIPNIGVADHLPVFICRKYAKKYRASDNINIRYRDMKNMNSNELLASLNSIPWETCFASEDINTILSSPLLEPKLTKFWINTFLSKHC